MHTGLETDDVMHIIPVRYEQQKCITSSTDSNCVLKLETFFDI